MNLTRNEKKKERERGKEGGAGHRECLFLANLFLLFPSFCLFFLFFEPLFGEIFFFLFFCAKNVFRVTKRGFFLVVVVVVGKGFIFFLSFWCEKTFCVHSFFFFFNENAFFLIIIIIIYINHLVRVVVVVE